GDYEDLRISGRDNKPYGPLPGDWVRFRGLRYAGDEVVVSYTVGSREVQEVPQWNAATGAFVRIMRVGAGKEPLRMKLDTGTEHIFPPHEKPQVYRIIIQGKVTVEAAEPGDETRFDPEPGRRFPGRLVTNIVPGEEKGPFAIDVLPTPPPAENPWQSWMRTSGFDFFEGGKSAAICTWNGDVWIVDGIDRHEGVLEWQRICSGLFQPLGLRIVDGEIYVGCRDMIALLHDENGDRETDYVEVFNNDHQVTEHFHEFAMGLQTDDEGNFYYAKSARHALTAVVPHHGTLLRVKKDGSRTDILATGFRAANGVCLNPDGSFIVTDQEGHWNPKNRINWVEGKGEQDFYGNMFGYHGITDSSDTAMNPPLCWITNQFDRSPAELLWVPEDSAWKSLRGSLLNLSYGYGKIYVVPHEKVGGQVQGGMCQLPFDQLPTGVMRGRFHSGDGQLYACGMFAWAGSQQQPGGFYRVRATGKPAHAPVGLEAVSRQLKVSFSDPLDRESTEKTGNWEIEAWDLKRTRNYGSRHYNQRPWQVTGVTLSADGRVVTLDVPDLEPTWGMSIRCNTKGEGGVQVVREIHNSIHKIRD
ncbi:MAG TPA: heme-binding protein, partial [Verrucomicrobiales bacterium]|nr:heme-binding protein [Verrucomicrobiales bacterium]